MRNPAGLTIASLAATALLAGAAHAEPISARYDGVYMGESRLAPGLSDPSCGALALTRIDIGNGMMRAWSGEHQTVKGFVTSDGFFNADYYFPGAQGIVFEGMISADGRLTGGIMRGRCAWLVALSRQ